MKNRGAVLRDLFSRENNHETGDHVECQVENVALRRKRPNLALESLETEDFLKNAKKLFSRESPKHQKLNCC
jgi:hypothetical protein